MVVADLDVELAEVCAALAACDGAVDSVTLSHVHIIFHIENSVLPMRILLVRRGRKHHGATQIAERGVEPCYNAVHAVGVLHLDGILTTKLYVSFIAVYKVEIEHFTGFRHNHLLVNGVHEGFLHHGGC